MADLIGSDKEERKDALIASVLVAASLADMSKADTYELLDEAGSSPVTYARVAELRKRVAGARVALEEGVLTRGEFTDVLRDEIVWWRTDGGR